ncbi:class I SAM-dependent methyltransferase [Actinomycetospora termitidis]|uniref:Class I SAM-dependent methyltransferase n=1 Tax=Actinomycetospora termitidis TaxID=3053470 RepID=A0ABT7MDP2_9PSEU|nr:class I SAM-dependent methyltransferase [Actinomycetospora sp. Odt1-22]MDL5158785.1 class I SAM-dependent methyltransferase [Actinomycetospora sp. Odt1-22]
MTTDRISEHYDRLAASYDEHWTYDPEYVRAFSRAITGALRLHPADAIADIGCGTGLYTRQLAEDLQPLRPILCVDPVPAMLDRVPASPALRPVLASAEDVASGHVSLPDPGPLDAVVVKESLHHVSDRAGTLRGLAGLLSDHGRLLVVMLPRTIPHPLFAAAHERFEQLQPDPDDVRDLVAAAGLRASVSYRTFHVAIDRERYVRMLESRYMSVLDEFSADELAEGIAQFRHAYREEPVLRFDDHFAFVTGWVRPAS